MPENVNPEWYPHAANNKSLLDFILWFSRFEYALKNGGFHKTSHGFLAPNWNKLKKHLQDSAIHLELKNALVYLRETPPNKQISHFVWEPVLGNDDWPFLIDCLLTIRNNLFHGAKQHPGQLLSPARDLELINHCQHIMRRLYDVVPEGVQIVFTAT